MSRIWLRPATGGLVALGAAGSLLAHRALVAPGGPLAAGDPLAGTLAGLPLIVAALAAIARAVAAAGGRRLAPRAGALELGAAVALAAVGLGRASLGFALPAAAVLAGLALVLAVRTARQVVALRPLLGQRLPQRPAAPFLLLPLTVYLALLPWSSAQRPPDGDEPYYLLITHSLAYDLDADLTNNYAAGDWRHFLDREIGPQPGDPVGPGGELYSRHNEALPMLLAPAYRLAGKTGALATMALLSALLAWWTLRLARHYAGDRPGPALVAWAILAFAPPLLLYSYQVWVEVPAALLGVVALDAVLAGEGLRRGRRWWLGVALPMLLLPLLKIRFLLLAGPLAVVDWWYAGRKLRPALIAGFALGGLAAGILAYNQYLYGNPLKIHSWGEVEPTRYPPAEYLKGLLGLFYDSAFGLFACSPLWLLLLALPLAWAVRGERWRALRPLAHLALLTLPYLLVVAPRSEWYGGWSPPFRYALVALPLLTVALVPVLARRRGAGARALVAGLAAVTLALTLLWLAVPGWTYSFADGRGHLLDLASGAIGADVARLFPSAVRPRTATWVWPLVTALLVPLAWALPRRRCAPWRAAGWGVAAVLVGVAAMVAAAERLPTREVHFEDPQVIKSGGHLYPERWTIERRRYHGGWVLREGEELRAPVVAGGAGVTIRLHVLFVRNKRAPYDLEIRAGDRLLALWRGRHDRQWQWVELGPFVWPAGEPLVLAAHRPGRPGRPNGAVFDEVDLTWHGWR